MAPLGSLNPKFEEVLQAFFDYATADLHTCMPAVVTAYHSDEQSVDVIPSLRRQYLDEPEPTSFPILQNVPLIFPSTAAGHLRFPVAVNDEVMLLFSERSLDEWFAKGGQVDPASPHRFNLADAVAIPGLRPKPHAVPIVGDLTSTVLACGGGWVEVTAAGKFKVTNAAGQDLLGILGSLITLLKTAPQTDGTIFNPATVASLTALEVELATLKA